MRRSLLLALGLALLTIPLGAVPASAITPAGFDCGTDDGREQLTPDGFGLSFTGPSTPSTGHDIAEGTLGQDYPDAVVRHASGTFEFRANFAPYQYGDLRMTLGWPGAGDFDLYVYDADGAELESSVSFNPQDGNGEELEVTGVAHCADLSVVVRNYAGQTDDLLTLNIQFRNPGPTFACEEEDPHPACADKLEGEAPSRLPDTRTRLYFGGDRPGQLAMAGHYPFATVGAGDPPLQGRLVSQRPTSGKTNSFTRTIFGNTNQDKNPFQAHFTLPFASEATITGDIHAVIWASSETLKDGGTLWVDLFVDGTSALAQTRQARAAIPGALVRSDPTRLAVVFQDVEIPVATDFTVQVSAEPVVATSGATGNPADAQWTLYYDSVQFPSRITLDPPTPVA